MAPVIPIVDFGPFLDPEASPESKKNVAMELDRACRDVGFFYLRNHGVPMELTKAMLDGAREFFETATPEDKQRIAIKKTSEGGDNARGWLQVRKHDAGSHEVSPDPETYTDGARTADMGVTPRPSTSTVRSGPLGPRASPARDRTSGPRSPPTSGTCPRNMSRRLPRWERQS